jgi:hypothetical protein
VLIVSTPSTIDKLPPEIKIQLREWLQDPRITQEQATDRTNELLIELDLPERVTKSSVNRAAMRWKKVDGRIRQQREVSEMFIAKVGAAPQGQSGLMINEILRTLAYDLTEKLIDIDLEDEETNLPAVIEQVKALSLTMQRLESAATNNVKRDNEIRKQEREKALQDAVKTVETSAKQAGISDETIQIIRRDVLRMAN